MDLFVAEIEYDHQRRRPELLAGGDYGVETFRFAERPQEFCIGIEGPAERGPLGKDDRPGDQGETEQQRQNAVTNRRGMADHFNDVALQQERPRQKRRWIHHLLSNLTYRRAISP